MKNNSYLFTSESVSEGHPDKVCDKISDMIVDTYLSLDPYSRVACETLTTTNKVVLAGETRGPDLDKEEIIQVGKQLTLRCIFISNLAILQWVLTHLVIKMKELVIRV